jgi:hypothetical protein
MDSRMCTPTKSLVAISISSMLLLGACEGDGGGDPPGDRPDASTRPDAMGSPDGGDPGAPDAAPSPADALWKAISGANDYTKWAPFPGHEGVAEYTGHGATHRRAFVNETAAGDLAGMPDGSILVKENLTAADATDPANLAAITVMQKQGSTWYWARFAPDGSYDVAGTTDEPGAAPCVSSGCHGDMAGSKNDYVFLNNEAQDAATIYAEITAAGDVYTGWQGFGAGTPAIKMDTTFGTHGSFNRTFINDVANGNEQNLADDSILVKENLTANDAAALDAITVMKKIAGIDPDNDDWFYVKLGPDGKVQLAGTLGANAVGCTTTGCHDATSTDGDFVYGN